MITIMIMMMIMIMIMINGKMPMIKYSKNNEWVKGKRGRSPTSWSCKEYPHENPHENPEENDDRGTVAGWICFWVGRGGSGERLRATDKEGTDRCYK